MRGSDAAPDFSMRILTVLARHGVDKYSGAEEDIQGLFARQLPRVERDVIVVDNALPGDVVERRPGRTLLGGDNRVREFTAFDQAIAWAGPSLRQLRPRSFRHERVQHSLHELSRSVHALCPGRRPGRRSVRRSHRLLQRAGGNPDRFSASTGSGPASSSSVRLRCWRSERWCPSPTAVSSSATTRRVRFDRRRRSRPDVQAVHHRLADGTGHRAGSDMAFQAVADPRGIGSIRAKGALHLERAHARHSSARDRLSAGRRDLAVGTGEPPGFGRGAGLAAQRVPLAGLSSSRAETAIR